MSFDPQYSHWSIDHLSNTDGATIPEPSKFTYVGGITRLVPIPTPTGSNTYGLPWDPITNWCVQNNLDTKQIVTGDFAILQTGDGEVRNINTHYGQALFTSTPLNNSGESFGCFIHNFDCGDTAITDDLTIQFETRTTSGSKVYDLGESDNFLHHGVFIGYEDAFAFIEIHPDGIRTYGSNKYIKSDMSSQLRTVRIASDKTNLYISLDNGDNVHIESGFITHGNTYDTYLSFGAPPTGVFEYRQADFTGDTQLLTGLTDITGFIGTTLWDNVKITHLEATINYPNGYYGSFPTGEQYLYTDAWHPNPSLSNYLGAIVDYIPTTGGYTIVTPQYKTYTGVGVSDVDYIDYTESLTLDGSLDEKGRAYLSLTSMPTYPAPFENEVRFKIVTSGNQYGISPSIDSISVFGSSPVLGVTFDPNWKMSSLSQDITAVVDANKFSNTLPYAHFDDDVFVHNEANLASLGTGEFLEGFMPGAQSGECIGNALLPSSQGLLKIDDGYYGNAWRNFNKIDDISGSFISDSYRYVTGYNVFAGDLVDTFDIYPRSGDNITGQSGFANVKLEAKQHYDYNGNSSFIQVVTVSNFASLESYRIGICATGIALPVSNDPYIAVVEGVIHIPNGPGIFINIHESETTSYSYYLDGANYRTPAPFGVSNMLYSGHDSDLSASAFYVSFEVSPRRSTPLDLDEDLWGDIKERLEPHRKDVFKIYSLTGYIADHSFLEYTGLEGNKKITPVNIDNDFTGVLEEADYYPVQRDSLIIEGWVRPYGFATANTGTQEAQIISGHFGTTDYPFNVYLNRDGTVEASFYLGVGNSSVYLTGDNTINFGVNGSSTPDTGSSTALSLTTFRDTINWGDWNHIGLGFDIRAIGDTYTASNQPGIPSEDEVIHGARSARAYLLLNNKVIAQEDISISPYIYTGFNANSISPTYPASGTGNLAFPPITRFPGTDNDLTIRILPDVVGDMDHFRVGRRARVDAFSDIAIKGGKAATPYFIPYDGIKIPKPETGSYRHWEYAHIYRFDYSTEYQGWDDGFAPAHLLFPHRFLDEDVIIPYSIKMSEVSLETVDGPKGRTALRLGPGVSTQVPYASFDERIFNGTGTYGIQTEGHFYDGGLTEWATGIGQAHYNTSANSYMRLGGFFKLNKLPGTGVMDLISYSQRAGAGAYGRAQVYLGVNPNGYPIFGTRENFIDNGLTSAAAVGPFSGTQVLEVGEWYHLGFDASLGIGNDNFMNLYLNGELNTGEALTITTGGSTSAKNDGKPIGYPSLLDPDALSPAFNIGGDIPRSHTSYNWTYRHGDICVSEVVIGYGLPNSNWNWATLASLSGEYTGHSDIVVTNGGTYIADIVSSGNGNTGVFTYPADDDTGLKLLWATSNGGNDFEGLLFAGIPLYGNGLFMNALSYYAIYESDEASSILGTTDSPIQLGNNVPIDGINLALINNIEWSTESATTTFDLSDDNTANITDRVYGDFILSNLTGDSLGVLSTGEIYSKNVRLSSYSLYDEDSSNQHVGYYITLLGGQTKGVYSKSSIAHNEVLNYTGHSTNLNKIKESITLTRTDGSDLTYDEFPYDVLIYSGNLTGINPDGVFTTLLIAKYQTINETVFINYPSYRYSDEAINMQDSEIYKPIPLMIRQNREDLQTGTYILRQAENGRGYDMRIYGASLDNFSTNP